MKGGKGGWSSRPKTSRRRVEKWRIEMGEVEEVDRYNRDGVPRVSPKARPSNIKRRSSEQLTERGHPVTRRRWRVTTRHHSRKGARGQDRRGRDGGRSRYDGTRRKRVWDESPSFTCGERSIGRRSGIGKKMIEGTERVRQDRHRSRNSGHWRIKPRRGLIDHRADAIHRHH